MWETQLSANIWHSLTDLSGSEAMTSVAWVLQLPPQSNSMSCQKAEMALQLFTLGEGTVTTAVALPFRLCSTCLLSKTKALPSPFSHSFKHLFLKSDYGKYNVSFLYISASAAARSQCKLHLCVLAAITWRGVTQKPIPSEDFSVSWSLLLLRKNNKQH